MSPSNAQDPFKLARELQRFVRDIPLSLNSAKAGALLRDLLADSGYEVPPPKVYSEADDPEHADITTFRLDPLVASMSFNDVSILIDDALEDYVPDSLRRFQAAVEVLRALQ